MCSDCIQSTVWLHISYSFELNLESTFYLVSYYVPVLFKSHSISHIPNAKIFYWYSKVAHNCKLFIGVLYL